MPKKATIGPAVYERVTELAEEGKTRTEAFAQVGQERGQPPGTVAANYYRTARSQGGTGRSKGAAKARRRPAGEVVAAPSTTARPTRARRSPARASTTRPAAPQGDLSALAAQIGDLVQQLVRQIEERDQRLRKLLG